MFDLIVTRHKDLIELLRKWEMVSVDTPIIEHTDDIEDVRGKNVIGVIPAKLAIFANTVTEVPLTIPPEYRGGKEIPLPLLEKMASEPLTYKVEQIETRTDFSEAVLASIATTFIQYVIRENIIPRGGDQHRRAVMNHGQVTIEEIKDKPVLGHLPYHLGQHALDISTVALYYEFERRGKVHSYEEMKNYNPQLITYRVVNMTSATPEQPKQGQEPES